MALKGWVRSCSSLFREVKHARSNGNDGPPTEQTHGKCCSNVRCGCGACADPQRAVEKAYVIGSREQNRGRARGFCPRSRFGRTSALLWVDRGGDCGVDFFRRRRVAGDVVQQGRSFSVPVLRAALDNLPKPNADGVPRPVQCRKCWEYSGLQKGFVSPYNPNAVEERPTFRSPLAQNVVWPRGCVQCGVEPTRFDEVGTFSVNKGLLVVGAVRVKTFKLPGVPYCAAHKKAVEMTTEIGNKLFLDWRSLAMMRRYMAANRGQFVESSSSGKS